ncbi:hypothetical protein GGR51DRAFT_106993 [Nemania sp. FL0031]|nr:hypothetical protein GGR51DRAFT_106993 [Nemania sp. FL0031]
MGSATPPKRMTRSRAAAASATAATLAPQVSNADKVSKSTKAPKATKATAASAKKPAAAKKTTAAAAAAKKSTAVKKTVTAKKSTTKTTAKTTATASTSSSTPSSVPTSTSTSTVTATSTSNSTSVSASTSTSSTSTSTATAPPATRKRKLRTYDHNDDDEDDLSKDDDTHPIMNRPAKKLRGPVKKTVDPESESETESVPRSKHQPKSKDTSVESNATIPVTRSTRGRPKKSTTTTATASTVDPQTSSTTSRTRARKATAKDDDASTTSKQPAAKATRGRKAAGTVTNTCTTEPTPGLKSAVSRPASKPSGMLKKTVTFEEPEKENVSHRVATQAKTETAGTSATGMRARPVRKPAASGRTTRASARAATTEMTEKKPLSPKKDGQNLPLSRDPGSDDELATYEKTPLKPLMKSPVKPASGIKKLELPPLEKEKDENSPPSLEPATHASVLSSPARRPPPSPFKDTMKSPAKRVDAIPSLILSSTSTEAQTAQSPSKSTMLQSPAKRPHMPLPAFPLSQDQVGAARSPTKLSLLHTPAKRPSSPKKLFSSPALQMEDEPMEVSKEVERTPMQEISEDELQSQIRAENCVISPPDPTLVAKALTPITEADNEDSIDFGSPLAFPGRLSAVLPRHADPALKQNPLPAQEHSVSMAQFDTPEPQKLEAMVVSEPSKGEPNATSPEENGSDLCKATIEEQHNDVGDAESNEISTSPSETESPNTSKEDFTVKTSEQPAVACEVKTQEQDMDIGTANPIDQSAESMDMDKSSTEEQTVSNADQAAQPNTTPKQAKTRGGDDMSDSEDELAFSNKATTKHKSGNQIPKTPKTPLPPLLKGPILKLPESATRAANRAIRSVSKGSGYGYSSVQLGAWRASSPLKTRQAQQKPGTQTDDDDDEYSLVEDDHPPAVETPAHKGFFDDEMRIIDDMETQAAIEAALEADIEAKFAKHDFNDLGLMDDLSIITEGDEMSLIDNQESDQSYLDDSPVLGTNRENGNQNSIPIDPTLTSNSANAQASSYAPVTPKRTFSAREVHTVSKVPLKRADDSPPRNVKRLCSTASKAALERPGDLFNHISLPGQPSSQTELGGQTDESKFALATPSKPASWSSVGTPARATRPDLDPTVLRGAIVFVDVHTTEGADAGRIFVDLLVQMGARCVKSWPWNPISPTGGEPDVSKVGITHVVFKDGGKRTLEKVVESKGAVQCVGVSWVLDCEKENRWLDEKDYRVDTSLVPRGGQNRRKSMEPKAIANVNGTLVTPMKVNSGLSREPQTVPNNYMSRRDSTIWMRSPSEHDEEDEDAPSEPSEMDWETTNALILTPVPQTPAPEMVARFAMNISPSTPTTSSFNPSAGHNQLLMQTCPPKPSGLINLGQGLVNSYQDPVQVRLMAARRKSMQFAPEVSSPLKKQWKPADY